MSDDVTIKFGAVRAGDYERDRESGLLLPRHARRGIERARPQMFMCGPAFFGGAGTTKLLVHADGSNGATTTLDSSPAGRTLSGIGGATLNTANVKYGTSSMIFNGNGFAFTAPASTDWNLALLDFTLEGYVLPTSGTITNNQGLIVCDAIGGTRGWLCYLGDGLNGSTLRALSFAAFNGATSASILSTSVPTISSWSHWAVTRASGVFRLFLNGTLVGTNSSFTTLSISSPGTPLVVGSLWGTTAPVANTSLVGNIDEVRVKVGEALYTASFTPPTAAFPNS